MALNSGPGHWENISEQKVKHVILEQQARRTILRNKTAQILHLRGYR